MATRVGPFQRIFGFHWPTGDSGSAGSGVDTMWVCSVRAALFQNPPYESFPAIYGAIYGLEAPLRLLRRVNNGAWTTVLTYYYYDLTWYGATFDGSYNTTPYVYNVNEIGPPNPTGFPERWGWSADPAVYVGTSAQLSIYKQYEEYIDYVWVNTRREFDHVENCNFSVFSLSDGVATYYPQSIVYTGAVDEFGQLIPYMRMTTVNPLPSSI